MLAKLHDVNGDFIQEAEIGPDAPKILMLRRETEKISGEIPSRRLVRFRLIMTENGVPFYNEIEERN